MFWDDEDHIVEYIEWLIDELRIEYPEQWYNYTPDIIFRGN
jgi:hypothetical protein